MCASLQLLHHSLSFLISSLRLPSMEESTAMARFVLGLFILALPAPLVRPQQQYTGNLETDCSASQARGFLYTCNGRNRACLAFLIFKSQAPFNSVPTISALMSSDLDELAQINNVTRLAIFPTDKEVIIPVNCSCTGQFYRAKTTFHLNGDGGEEDNFNNVANSTFQGLASCVSLKQEALEGQENELRVPLRCACPTRNQSISGIRYLLTYPIDWGDTIQGISDRFNATVESVLEANGFSDNNPTIFPFTTILIPLRAKPSSLQMSVPFHAPGLARPPSPAHVSRNPKSHMKIILGFGVSAGCSLVLATVLFSVFWLYRKRREEKSDCSSGYYEERGRKMILPADLRVEIASLEGDLRVFSLEELNKATRNFSSGNRIQGSVYRGMFGQEILAVKKKSAGKVSEEVSILNKINHFNIVRLRGFCHAKNGACHLVFENMSGGSLKDWLKNNRSCRKIKSWRQRIQIALDVANGLHYLHSFTKPAYVHGNISSSNVLLNANLRAKIGNFSLAQAISEGASMEEAGTVTAKLDVYDFGIVLLKLIAGKDGEEFLPLDLVSSPREDEIWSFVDSRLGKGAKHLGVKMVKLSLNCLAPEPDSRPGMEEVVSVLLRIQREIFNVPKRKR